MIQRTRPQAKTDDHAFPIRVKLAIPHHDRVMLVGPERPLGNLAARDRPATMREALGRLEREGPGDGALRTLEDAQACLAAFPEFELADGVGSATYYSPMW